MADAARPATAPPVSLALQGGGAHGAFTWGVLDRLLEDEHRAFDALSGTSAGAVNAVLLASGLLDGGHRGARERLAAFWQGVALKSPFAPQGQAVPRWLSPRLPIQTPAQWLSPYQFNPMDLNPLRALLGELVDFTTLRHHCAQRLFIAATHVRSGRLRLFTESNLTLDALLASACLPTLHHAVTIEGEAYWDGGFAANPPVRPLLEGDSARDIVIVLLLPLNHEAVPRDADTIRAREAELAFSASFMRDMQWITELRRQQRTNGGEHAAACFSRNRFHLLENDALMRNLSAHSRLNTQQAFLQDLFRQGRKRAGEWLRAHESAIGHSDTADLEALFGEWPGRGLPIAPQGA